MSIATTKLVNLGDAQVLYNDLRGRAEDLKRALPSLIYSDARVIAENTTLDDIKMAGNDKYGSWRITSDTDLSKIGSLPEGFTTAGRVFVMSVQQAGRYIQVVMDIKSNVWLRYFNGTSWDADWRKLADEWLTDELKEAINKQHDDSQRVYIVTSDNLFDRNDCELGNFDANGDEKDSTTEMRTKTPIAIKGGYIATSVICRRIFYDASMTRKLRSDSTGNAVEIPSWAAYVRFSLTKARYDDNPEIMVNIGEAAGTYKAFSLYVKYIDSGITGLQDDVADIQAEIGTVPTGETLQGQIDDLDGNKADIIKTTASGAVASFPDGADGLPVESLVVKVDPVQDLHGYDYPWPAGGGKNILTTAGLTLGTPSDTTYSNATKRTFTVGTYISGLTHNNYYISRATGITVSDNLIKFTTTASAYGISIPLVGLEVGSQYTISASTTGMVGLSFYQQDGTYISGGNASTSTHSPYTATIPENTYYTVVLFVATENDTETTFTNIQLEKSSSATTYAPYSNICPISGWTGANVSRTGKNLFGGEIGRYMWANGVRYTNDTGAYCASDKKIPIKGGADYAISIENTGNTNSIAFSWFSGDTFISLSSIYNATSGTVKAPENANMCALTFRNTDSYTGEPTVSNVSVSVGSTASDYEAYHGNTYSITFPSEAGTVYGGTLTVNEDGTGELVVDRRKRTLTKNDSFSIGISTSLNRITVSFYENQGKLEGTFVSDSLKTMPNSTGGYGTNPWEIWGSTVAPRMWISVPSSIDTVEKFKTYIQSNPIDVVYELATPVTYQLTELEVIETLKGVNNVWATTGNTNVTYRADTKLYIEKLTKPSEDDMIANANIQSGKFFMVGNNLFLSTQAIAQGATITPGTNCTALSLAEALNTINA